MHRVIKFNQKAWLKSCIYVNKDLRKKAKKKKKNDFHKEFFKLMNNAVFGKTMENVRKHFDFKLVTTERRRNCLASEPNSHSENFFMENFLAVEMTITRILKNKPVYLGISILEISKIVIYEF